jgi:signal transduction histidine kinase
LLIRDIRIKHIDIDVRLHADREARRTRDLAGWQMVEGAIAAHMGVRDSNDLLFLVQDTSGTTRYHSSWWTGDFDPNSLPWPKTTGSYGPGDRENGVEAAPRIPGPTNTESPDPQASDLRPAQPAPATAVMGKSFAGRHWRIGLATTERSRVLVAVDTAIVNPDMSGIRNAFLIATPVILVPIAIGSWVFSGRMLRTLRTLTAAARRISAQKLDQRISVPRGDSEFLELIDVFNGMLERLERSFSQARRFSADAAHELQTPLAILQGQLEKRIREAEDGSPLQADLKSILDEVQRMSSITRKLLLLSQADAGRLRLHRELFSLSEALSDLMEDARMLAPHLDISGDIQPGLVINADCILLTQVLQNLMSNAIKYNVGDGWIRVSAGVQTAGIEVRICNSSNGIPAAERERVFDRFYRSVSARNKKIEGVGLGLSVSREIARAHGGDIALRAAEDGSVQFSLVLPATAVAVSSSSLG